MKLESLDVGEIYAITIGSLFVLLISWQVAAILRSWRHLLLSYVRRHVEYTTVLRRLNGTSDVTFSDALAIVALLSVNTAACWIRVGSTLHLSQRAGHVALVNLILLFLGGRTSYWVSKICGLSLRRYGVMHRWIGRLFVLQSLLHAIGRIAQSALHLSIFHTAVRQIIFAKHSLDLS